MEIPNARLGIWKEFISVSDYHSAVAAVPPYSKEIDFIKCEFGKARLSEGKFTEAAEVGNLKYRRPIFLILPCCRFSQVAIRYHLKIC